MAAFVSDYEVAELRWENGQVANLNGNITNPPPQMFNQTWDNINQSTFNTIFPQHDLAAGDDHVKFSSKFLPTSSGGKRDRNSISGRKWTHENSFYMGMDQNNGEVNEVKVKVKPTCSGGKYGEDSSPGLVKKRVIMRRKSYDQVDEGASERSGCASQSATFCTDDTTMMTWASFDAYNNPSARSDEERKNKGESFRSHSSARSSRAAAVHNQSERRRRDRINQKMKALQKLVPNASKTDKVSMLDEVIEYLKQLQAQVRMMSNARSCIMPQMMMPLAMQQQLQMSYLARMAMAMGMGNAHSTLYPFTNGSSPLGSTAPSFLSPLFAMPPVVAPPSSSKANTFVPNFNEAYKTLLAQQSMNLDFFNKVAAFHGRQQANQPSNKPISFSEPNNGL